MAAGDGRCGGCSSWLQQRCLSIPVILVFTVCVVGIVPQVGLWLDALAQLGQRWPHSRGPAGSECCAPPRCECAAARSCRRHGHSFACVLIHPCRWRGWAHAIATVCDLCEAMAGAMAVVMASQCARARRVVPEFGGPGFRPS
jgi:hypothetical protein